MKETPLLDKAANTIGLTVGYAILGAVATASGLLTLATVFALETHDAVVGAWRKVKAGR